MEFDDEGSSLKSVTDKRAIEATAAYSKEEAALITGTSYSTVHRAIEAGELRVARPNRRVVVLGSSLIEWLQPKQIRGRSSL